ncbi:MAG: phage Gp37/Gp68 family protein [Deltaproteobacteria bacterium]|nr:phage Gp37/Gp68 family protein [Deltaproteobacteria bacterium]
MATFSSIEWTEQTWNPTTGCSKISPGCANCYAEIMARRLQAMGVPGYERGFEVTLQPHRLDEPLKRKKPTVYFVNSMSDLFHEDIPDDYINKVLNIMRNSPRHIFQVLTKRADRMAEFFNTYDAPSNAWIGVTVENKKDGLPRLELLKSVKASVRFLSVEPLLENLGVVDFGNIEWVIVGGESGNRARLMEKKWVLNIKVQCEKQGVPFFFKQWGTWGPDMVKRQKKKNGRKLQGKTWDAMPQLVMTGL